MHQVKVNRKAADRIASGHPWIFTTDVVDRGAAEPGDAVHVLGAGGRLLGTAHYSSTSQITLRLLSASTEPIDRAFFTRRLQAAQKHREKLVQNSDAYRLVHGEGDLLPALVIDRYADCFTIQTLSQGMDKAKRIVVECLEEIFHPRSIVARNDVAVRARETLPLESGVLSGDDPGPVDIMMNGLRWSVDILHGQKTGVYLDQRENYAAAARFAHGLALDAFTSTGGFALHLAPRCTSVEAVDSSEKALQTASANGTRNQISNISFRQADVFDLLSSSVQARRRFDTVVLDPPAFAKSRGSLDTAARGYKEINYRALRLLNSGGILVSCSCSHHFSEAMLLETIAEAALDAGRTLRVLDRRTQAADHPILLTVPETHYLKCLIFQVL